MKAKTTSSPLAFPTFLNFEPKLLRSSNHTNTVRRLSGSLREFSTVVGRGSRAILARQNLTQLRLSCEFLKCRRRLKMHHRIFLRSFESAGFEVGCNKSIKLNIYI